MRGLTLLTLLAFVAHAHAEEVAPNDLDKFVDQIVNELFDKVHIKGEEDEEGEEVEETEEGHETEEGEAEEANDEVDETQEDNESEEVAATDMDRLVDKLVDRARTGLSFLPNADLDTATLAKPKDSLDASKVDLEDDRTLAAAAQAAAARGLSTKKVIMAMKAMKAGKVMKAMKAMKAMKGMKKKRVSKIAKGKLAKSIVFRGGKLKTRGGLTKSDLVKNKRGRIVSKKQMANGKMRYKNIKAWAEAVAKARKALSVTGFVAIKKGSALYTKAKAFAR
jgi:hypothetical protein